MNHHATEIDEENHCVTQTIQHERVHVICLIGSICCVVIAGADIRRLLLFAPFFSSRPGLLAQQARLGAVMVVTIGGPRPGSRWPGHRAAPARRNSTPAAALHARNSSLSALAESPSLARLGVAGFRFQYS